MQNEAVITDSRFKPFQVKTKKRAISYAKWGYIFLIPFFATFLFFSLIPLLETFHYSFYEYWRDGLDVIGPNWVGFKNYGDILSDSFGEFWKDLGNTMIIWILGFVPQIIISLVLAIIFTSVRLKLRGAQFFKTIFYMPNLVMAAAMGLLFSQLLSQSGPIMSMLFDAGLISEKFKMLDRVWDTRAVIGFIDFLMWFGNTMLLLMSGVMGIDASIYEAATIDGSSAWKTFWHITMPLLMPIFIYVFITSMIGGIQLYDAATIFTQGTGGAERSSYTLMMFLFNVVNGSSHDLGHGGALSVLMFIITGLLSFSVFILTVPKEERFHFRSHKKKLQKEVQGGISR